MNSGCLIWILGAVFVSACEIKVKGLCETTDDCLGGYTCNGTHCVKEEQVAADSDSEESDTLPEQETEQNTEAEQDTKTEQETGECECELGCDEWGYCVELGVCMTDKYCSNNYRKIDCLGYDEWNKGTCRSQGFSVDCGSGFWLKEGLDCEAYPVSACSYGYACEEGIESFEFKYDCMFDGEWKSGQSCQDIGFLNNCGEGVWANYPCGNTACIITDYPQIEDRLCWNRFESEFCLNNGGDMVWQECNSSGFLKECNDGLWVFPEMECPTSFNF